MFDDYEAQNGTDMEPHAQQPRTEHECNAINELVDKSHDSLAKIMELICFISAGSMAIVTTLHQEAGFDRYAMIGMVAMIAACVLSLLWFWLKAKQFAAVADIIYKRSGSPIKPESTWSVVVRAISMFAFALSLAMLLLSSATSHSDRPADRSTGPDSQQAR